METTLAILTYGGLALSGAALLGTVARMMYHGNSRHYDGRRVLYAYMVAIALLVPIGFFLLEADWNWVPSSLPGALLLFGAPAFIAWLGLKGYASLFNRPEVRNGWSASAVYSEARYLDAVRGFVLYGAVITGSAFVLAPWAVQQVLTHDDLHFASLLAKLGVVTFGSLALDVFVSRRLRTSHLLVYA